MTTEPRRRRLDELGDVVTRVQCSKCWRQGLLERAGDWWRLTWDGEALVLTVEEVTGPPRGCWCEPRDSVSPAPVVGPSLAGADEGTVEP